MFCREGIGSSGYPDQAYFQARNYGTQRRFRAKLQHHKNLVLMVDRLALRLLEQVLHQFLSTQHPIYCTQQDLLELDMKRRLTSGLARLIFRSG